MVLNIDLYAIPSRFRISGPICCRNEVNKTFYDVLDLSTRSEVSKNRFLHASARVSTGPSRTIPERLPQVTLTKK